MVEHCGVEVGEQLVEECESFEASLVCENLQADVGEKPTWLSTCCGRISLDHDFIAPSKFNIADAGGEEASIQSDKKINDRRGVGIVRELFFEASDEGCKEELPSRVSELSLKFANNFEENEQNCMVSNASLENSLTRVIDHQAESNICSQMNDKNGPSEILSGIRSLSFCVEDGNSKHSDVNLYLGPASLSHQGQYDGISETDFDRACNTSLTKEVLVGNSIINPPSCLDIVHPKFGDINVETSRSVDIQDICHQHLGPKHHMNHSATDESTICDDAAVSHKSHLEHSGFSPKSSLLDHVPRSSSKHVLGKGELDNSETNTVNPRERLMHDKPFPVHESSLHNIQGLPDISVESLVTKTEIESSPVTGVKIIPSLHSSNGITVHGYERHAQEQVLHASSSHKTLSERKHTSSMRKISVQVASHEEKKDNVEKRGRRSSKAVKFDECMKSFSVVSRKKRSFLSKPASSYIWWSSGTVLQSPNIGTVAGASENASWGCGYNKSKRVGKKRESGSLVIGDKVGTLSTSAPLKGKSKRRVDQTRPRELIPDIHECSPSQATDRAFQYVREFSGQLKGEYNIKQNKSNRGIWPLQADFAFANSKQLDTIHDTLKLDDNHQCHNHEGVTHGTTGSAADVYLTSNLQDDVKAVEENVEKSFLDPKNSPDSEVINPIQDICLAERAENDMVKDVPLTVSGYLGIQGGATSINFTYSSRKKGKKKEMHVLGGNCSPISHSTISASLLPKHNFNTVTNTSKSVELSESISGILDSGIKDVKNLGLYPSQSNMASDIEETSPDQKTNLGNDFTSGAALEDKPDSDVPNAWASCDICGKWRRIQSALADHIARTNCTWTCNENLDKAFADCSVPQEKSDHAINIELELSDCDEDVDEVSEAVTFKKSQLNAAERERWTPIKTNSYLHRKRKNQTIDEIMVCHCKPPRDGGLGCGEECLNRMLNIECVRKTCPCGDLCSNQQFQERKYAKLKSFRCGKKGYGLRSEENIGRGQFLIEYVGEVLDMPAYEARQKDYALKGHKHFYFMTLNGSEIIDACSKGNLGRYINHSCEPNCRTEKWMVNGEICIGLFAIRNIRKGEEVTFDYNYVRVFGAAAKKCKCGSSQCRGFIGGDPLNCEVVAHDSDDEDSQELEADRESNIFEEILSTTTNTSLDENQDAVLSTEIGNSHLEVHGETENSADASTSSFLRLENLEDSNKHLTQPLCIPRVEDTLSIADKPFESETSSLIEELGNDTHLKTCLDSVEVDQEPPRSLALRKSRVSSASLKKKNNKAPKIKLQKSELVTSTLKKALTVCGHHDVVQEKLNELLDSGGGISSSKRRESAKGYLKLLILTTASDNSGNGEAIQSNRDLSMILDALLKTKSRTVLSDIINKNGLRMLHNMMKHYRRDFNRTPILRKLLKILEYLAEIHILNSDQINAGPPCPGMESFAESVLMLTEHRNRQVHQIARSFRDKWIRRPIRKFSCKDEGKSEFLRGSTDSKRMAFQSNYMDRPKDSNGQVLKAVMTPAKADSRRHEDCLASLPNNFVTSGLTGRKRKSRWDQDEWIRRDGTCARHKDLKVHCPDGSVLGRLIEGGEMASSTMNTMNVRDSVINSEVSNMDEDLPPGFTAPCQDRDISGASPVISNLGSQIFNWTPDPYEVVKGHPQRKFISRSPVSYSIPVSTVDQDVASQYGTVCDWEISPSLPFYPFPPLPSYPRTAISPPGSSSVSVVSQAQEGCISSKPPGASTVFVGGSSHINRQYCHKRPRGSTEGSGNTFVRQKKLNIPPWMRRRQVGFVQNNPRNVMCKGEVRKPSF